MAITNRFKNLASAATDNRFKGLTDNSQATQSKPLATNPIMSVAPKPAPIMSVAPKPAAPEEPSFWNKAAKAVLPKKAEDYFGLNGKPGSKLGEFTKSVAKNILTPGKEMQAVNTILNPLSAAPKVKERVEPAVLDVLNHPVVQKGMNEASKRTTGTGAYSMIQAIGPKTFEEAYRANKAAQAGDPSQFNQLMYDLMNSGPQTVLGVALNFIPYAGVPLSTAYWTALSANEQVESKGKVESLNPVLIDVAMDRMLGSSIEGLLKMSSKTLLKTAIKTFGVEGGTEFSQDILKQGDALARAKTSEEKAQIIQDTKDYFTSGQALRTFLVGGIIGAGIGGGAYALNKAQGGSTQNQSAIRDNLAIKPSIIESRLRDAAGQVDNVLLGKPTAEATSPLAQKIAGMTEEFAGVDSPGQFYTRLADVIKADKTLTPQQVDLLLNTKGKGINATVIDMFSDIKFNEIASPVISEEGLSNISPYTQVDETGGGILNDVNEVTNPIIPETTAGGAREKSEEDVTNPELKKRYAKAVEEVVNRGGVMGISRRIFELENQVSQINNPGSLEYKRLSDEVVRLRQTLRDFEDAQNRLKRTQAVSDITNADVAPRDQMQPLPRTVGEAIREENINGPGHKKLERFLQNLLKDGSILPEDATIIRTIVEDFDDSILDQLKFERIRRDDGKKSGQFRFSILARLHDDPRKIDNLPDTKISRGSGRFRLRTGLSNENVASWVFAHEFSHLGYWFILTEEERQIVIDEYNKLDDQQIRSLFSPHVAEGYKIDHYVSNPREFFAQSGADYIMENKIPTAKMEPLLKRVARRFFEKIKTLVYRQEAASVKRLSPLFEKILTGDKSTPLSDFAASEPQSFKVDIQAMLERGLAPETTRQQTTAPLFTGSKQVPTETLMPDEPTVPRTDTTDAFTKSLFATEPKVGDSPIEAAEQIQQSLPPDIASTIEPVEAVIMGEKFTPLNERVAWYDYFRTPWRVFEKMKIAPVYQSLLKGYTKYSLELPKNIDKITAWSKRVSKESNERIFRSLDGENINLNQDEVLVAKEIKAYLAEWADRLGMSPDARISEYITHIFPVGKNGEMPEEISAIINDKIPGSVYNPFLLQRKGAEGYIKDTWKALDAYTKRATRKVHMDAPLAELKEASAKLTDTSQINYLKRYANAINLRPSELDTLIDNHLKRIFGYKLGVRPTITINRKIRKMISRAKIGGSVTSWALNLTQGVNTFGDLGTKYVLRGYIDLAKFKQKELEENGVLIAPFIEDRAYSAVKKFAEKADNILFVNMSASEAVNRGAAYYGAKAKFIDGKISNKEYRLAFGQEKPANYKPTLEDAIHYGKYVSGKTQFMFGPLETPLFLNSDVAKTAAQFQTFSLKQGEFIGNMIAEREWLKLIRYTFSSMLLFATVGSAFGMKWDDSWWPFRFGYPPAVQFVMDTWRTLITGKDKYGNKLSAGEKLKVINKTLLTNIVPGGAQINRSVEGFNTVDEGVSRSKSGKFQYKVDQGPMNYVRGTLFGKYNLPDTKDYYKEKDNAGSKSSGSGGNRFKGL